MPLFALPVTELYHNGEAIGQNHPVLFALSGLIIVALYIGPGIAVLISEAVKRARNQPVVSSNVFHLHLRRRKDKAA